MPEQRCSLGATIRARRMELGWSQEELAERISTDDEYVRQSEISRIESGRVALPRRRRLELLAIALDIPLGELLAHSGWAGANEAFDSHPVMLSKHGSAVDVAERGGRAQQFSTAQAGASSGMSEYRARIAPAADSERARNMRLQRLRETTEEIQKQFERNRHSFESMRRQFIGSDLSTGTR